jgi:hypothetical protein
VHLGRSEADESVGFCFDSCLDTFVRRDLFTNSNHICEKLKLLLFQL